MINLKPITFDNIDDFSGTSYSALLSEQRAELIQESQNMLHNGSYFEFLAIYEQDTVVGFINLYAHSEHTISCAPEIKSEFQNKGFGYLAVTLALEYAMKKGYTKAVADIEENNAASIALHHKLGFKMERRYLNKNNRMIRFYTKQL